MIDIVSKITSINSLPLLRELKVTVAPSMFGGEELCRCWDARRRWQRLPLLSSFLGWLSVHTSEVVGAGEVLLKWAYCGKDTGKDSLWSRMGVGSGVQLWHQYVTLSKSHYPFGSLFFHLVNEWFALWLKGFPQPSFMNEGDGLFASRLGVSPKVEFMC